MGWFSPSPPPHRQHLFFVSHVCYKSITTPAYLFACGCLLNLARTGQQRTPHPNSSSARTHMGSNGVGTNGRHVGPSSYISFLSLVSLFFLRLGVSGRDGQGTGGREERTTQTPVHSLFFALPASTLPTPTGLLPLLSLFLSPSFRSQRGPGPLFFLPMITRHAPPQTLPPHQGRGDLGARPAASSRKKKSAHINHTHKQLPDAYAPVAAASRLLFRPPTLPRPEWGRRQGP